MQSRAVQESESITQSRLAMFEQLGSSISWPFLMVLVFWICVLFRKRQLVATQAARVTILGCQFHGSSSASRLIG